MPGMTLVAVSEAGQNVSDCFQDLTQHHPESFQKDKEDGEDKAEEGGDVIPLQSLCTEHHKGHCGEDCKGNNLLNHFELHQVERTSVANETDAVCRNLCTVLKECNAPGKYDDRKNRPPRGNLHLLKLEVAVPGECHKDVGCHQQ